MRCVDAVNAQLASQAAAARYRRQPSPTPAAITTTAVPRIDHYPREPQPRRQRQGKGHW